MFIAKAIIYAALLLNLAQAISVCDEIDISFIIDEDSLVNNLDGVLFFIESIIEHGSSEASAFSVHFYGDNMNYDRDITLLDTFDTFRSNKTSIIRESLLSNVKPASTVSISLQDAFNAAAQQEQPSRNYTKRNIFNNDKYKIHHIGDGDDRNTYFIFDYYNKLIPESKRTGTDISSDSDEYYEYYNDNPICTLLDAISTRANSQPDYESVHFVRGVADMDINPLEIGLCNDIYTNLLGEDTFFILEPFDSETIHFETYQNYLYSMESLYHISCPAHIEQPQLGGSIGLTSNNQWIDPTTFISCHIVDLQYDDIKTEGNTDYGYYGIDPDKSYILVHDYLLDGNTFKADDHLIATPETRQEIRGFGCSEPIYKIIRIENFEIDNDYHKTLKLYVGLPESPQDYILYADIKAERMPFMGEHDSFHQFKPFNRQQQQKQRRRLPSYDPVPSDSIGGKVDGEDDKSHDAKETGTMSAWAKTKVKLYKTYGWKEEKTIGAEKDKNGFGLTVEGKGNMEILASLHAAKKSTFGFEFKWTNLFRRKNKKDDHPGSTVVTFTIEVYWGAHFKFFFGFKGSLDAKAEKMIGHTFTVPIGPVPLVIKPYIGLKLTAKTSIVDITFRYEVEYEEKIVISYGYHGTREKGSVDFGKVKEDLPTTSKISGVFKKLVRSMSMSGRESQYHLGMLSKTMSMGKVELPPKKTTHGSGPIVTREIKKKEISVPVIEIKSGQSESKDPCMNDFKITFTITPFLGVKIYGAVDIRGQIDITIPVHYSILIPHKTCNPKKQDICGTKAKKATKKLLYANPTVEVTMKLGCFFGIKMPNFVLIIKEIYKVRKLITAIKDDMNHLAKSGEESVKKLFKIYTHFTTEWAKIKAHKNKGYFARFELLVNTYKKLNHWAEKSASGWPATLNTYKENFDMHLANAKKIHDRVENILHKPFQLEKVEGGIQSPVITLVEKQEGTCKSIDKDLSSIFAKQCCGKTYNPAVPAHVGFADWYNGYDGHVNDDEYVDNYYDYDYSEYYSKKQLNSAPIVHSRYNSNNPILSPQSLLYVDIVSIVILFICIASCCCLLFGSFAAYYYHKESTKEDQNDNQI